MRLRGLLLCTTLLLPLPLAGQATNYTYTGPDFNEFFSNLEPQVYTSNNFVTVDFTLSAPLLDNLTSLTVITPTSFTISDGYQTFTDLTAAIDLFAVGTDASGAITAWDIYAGTDYGGHQDRVETYAYPGYANDTGLYDHYQSQYSEGLFLANGADGTWTSSPANVPESNSPLYGLISTAALVLGFAVRRLVPPLLSPTPIAS
jgi:hypothetical protein